MLFSTVRAPGELFSSVFDFRIPSNKPLSRTRTGNKPVYSPYGSWSVGMKYGTEAISAHGSTARVACLGGSWPRADFLPGVRATAGAVGRVEAFGDNSFVACSDSRGEERPPGTDDSLRHG